MIVSNQSANIIYFVLYIFSPTMRAPELLQQAESLKPVIIDENGDVEWQNRLELQHLLENAISIDLDYSISKQAEQTLWNFCFKNCIDAYQSKLRRRKTEADVANLQLFLDSCIGHFTNFLARLCRDHCFALDCYKSDAALGILNGHFRRGKSAQKETVNYLAHFCLIHLGDIARYQKNIEQAEYFYIQAWQISPDNGHALNQLAILETSSGRHLSALSLYTRSLYIRNPFQLAAGNIEKFCDTIEASQDSDNFMSLFFRQFATAHSCRRLEDAENLSRAFMLLMLEACDANEVDATDLEQMLVVVIGEIWRITSLNDDPSKIYESMVAQCSKNPTDSSDPSSLLSADEFRCLRIMITCLRSIATASMIMAAKNLELGTNDFLITVKLASDFLALHPEICTVCCPNHLEFVVRLLSALSILLNQLQSLEAVTDKKLEALPENAPLPEDFRLRGFLPLERIHEKINFADKKLGKFDQAAYVKTRISRLISFGKFICQRVNNSEIIACIEDGEKWTFSAKSPSEVTPSSSPIDAATSTAQKTSGGSKRHTKVVPLIRLLEREKAAVASSKSMETKKESPELKKEMAEFKMEVPRTKTESSSKPAGQKTVRIKSPDPILKSDTPSPPTSMDTNIAPMAPRFQAARLKQALTGEGKSPGELPPMPSPWELQQQPPMGAWFPRGPPAPLRLPHPHPPSLAMPARPMGASPVDMVNFHRTPGVRPPGPPPFPPPPMFSGPPPPPWDPRPQSTTVPSLYLGRNEDPYYRNWPRQFGPPGAPPPRNAVGDGWRKPEWSWADGTGQPPPLSNSPFFDLPALRPVEPSRSGLATFGNTVSEGGARQEQEAQFSLFGIDSPWEYASERLQSRGGKE